MAPNGYPNGGRLINLLSQLHTAFSIFPKHRSKTAAHRAVMAADRWRAMCKHCLMLVKSNTKIPDRFEGLKEVVAAIQLGYDPTAATASVTDSLPGLDDTYPARLHARDRKSAAG